MQVLPTGVFSGSTITGKAYTNPPDLPPIPVYRMRPDMGPSAGPGDGHMSILNGGNTKRAYESTAPTFDVFTSESQAGGRGPGVTYSAAWDAEVSVFKPLRKGIQIYEPQSEFDADPEAIGWQHQGGEFYLDQSRCSAQGSDFYNTVYIPWYNAWGDVHWYYFRDYFAWEAPTSGTWDIDVTTATISPIKGWGSTFQIGTLGSYIYLTSNDTGSNPNFEYARASDVTTPVSGTSYATAIQTISLPVTSLPVTTVGEYGSVVLLAVKIADIPPPYTTLSSGQYDRATVNLDVSPTWNNVNAVSRPFWLLYATPQDVTVTPGLAGVPKHKLVRFYG